MKINNLPKRKEECLNSIIINNSQEKARIININSFDAKNVYFSICFLDENGNNANCFKIASKSNIVKGKFNKTIDYSLFDDEIWVNGYKTEDLYMVSNKGRIKNIKTDVEVCGYSNKYGYVQLDNDKIPFNYKHVYIYYSFNKNENPEDSNFAIDHINRIRDDNSIDNLRRVTHLDNAYNKTNTVVAKIKHLDSGEIFITDRLAEFCRDKNIILSLLIKTFNKERSHTNGYVMIDKRIKNEDSDDDNDI